MFGTLIIFPIFNFFGLYANIFRQTGLKTLSIIFYACFLYGFIFFLLIIFFQSYLIAYEINYVGSIPRSIGIIHPIIFYVLIITSRFFIAYSYQYLNIVHYHLGLGLFSHFSAATTPRVHFCSLPIAVQF